MPRALRRSEWEYAPALQTEFSFFTFRSSFLFFRRRSQRICHYSAPRGENDPSKRTNDESYFIIVRRGRKGGEAPPPPTAE